MEDLIWELEYLVWELVNIGTYELISGWEHIKRLSDLAYL
jgi:hypothetical protein